jgi:ArsR family transcriptional regulator
MTQQWPLQEFKADFFRTLGNPVRIRILEALRSAGELSVTEIQQTVGIEPSNASQHLSVLRSRGVVVTSREGTTVRYSIADPEVYALLDTARKVFEKRLASQQEALEAQPATP